jgi:hypothetical protein
MAHNSETASTKRIGAKQEYDWEHSTPVHLYTMILPGDYYYPASMGALLAIASITLFPCPLSV